MTYYNKNAQLTENNNEIVLEILTPNSKKQSIATFKNFNFDDLVAWVYRNCKGCEQITIYPQKRIDVLFEDRAEVYTVETSKNI